MILREHISNLETSPNSIKEIEKTGVCSAAKARKILITAGRYSSPRTAEITRLYSGGASVPEIAERLGISTKAVNAFQPYKKGTYLSDEPTENALNIRRYRERLRGGAI